MKKFYSVLFVISFLFVFTTSAFAMSISITHTSSCSFFSTYDNADNYKSGPCLLEQTEFPVKDFEINWFAGDVEINYHKNNIIEISDDCEESLNESEMLHYLYDNGKLIIQFCKSNFQYTKKSYKKLIITLPENMKLDSFSIKLTSGALKAKNLNTNSFNADLTSGDIVTSFGSELENVNIDFTSGEISITAPYVKDIDCKLTSGELSFTVTKQAPDSIKVKATSGSVDFKIPENDGFTLSIDKTSGSFHNSGFYYDEIDDDTYYYKNSQNRDFIFDITSGEINFKKF